MHPLEAARLVVRASRDEIDLDAAAGVLERALADKLLRVLGQQRGGMDRQQRLSPGVWAHKRLDLRAAATSPKGGRSGPAWTDLRFLRRQVLELWPPDLLTLDEAHAFLEPRLAAEPREVRRWLLAWFTEGKLERLCATQLTSSAGLAPGVRIRLGFWLDRPAGRLLLQRWLAEAPVDPSVFRAVQPIYVARPLLRGGVRDPVRRRSGVLWGTRDAVPVPELPEPAAVPLPPTHSPAGKRYVSGGSGRAAARRRAALAGAVGRAAKGGRHRCLVWAAARAVELDDALPRATIAEELIGAARRAGLDDPDRELQRQGHRQLDGLGRGKLT
jgi:hypothetical protein